MSSNANQEDQILEAQPEKLEVPASSLAAKVGSKNEMYRLLTADAAVYLPPKRHITTYFMGDLLNGKKKRKYFP